MILKRNFYYLLSIILTISIFYCLFCLEGVNLLDQVFSRGGDYKGRVGFDYKKIFENVLN